MRNIITIAIAFFLSASLTGCGKKAVPDSVADRTIWQEMEVVQLEPAEYKHGITDAGYSGRTSGGSGLIVNGIVIVGHIIGSAANLVARGVSSIDSSMTAGPGAVLLVDRLDDNSTQTKRTIVLRLSDEELFPDDVTAIYLDGAHSDKTDVKIGSRLAGLFTPQGGLLKISSDLALVGKSVKDIEEGIQKKDAI